MAPASPAPRRRFSIAHLALISPWVALVIDAFDEITDNSFLWHIRAGSLQVDAGQVLTTDPFSFTAGGESWLTQSWLVELVYAWGEDLSDLGFVPVMLLVIGSLAFLGVGLYGYRVSQSVPATSFILILTVLALISFLVPRPVLFSYLLMILVMLAWDRPETRWALPFLFWIWASVHGSFVIGLVYIGLALLMERDWKWLPTAVVSALAILFTAHGLGVIEFLVQFGSNRDALAFITEWRAPELLETVFLPILGGLAFIVVGSYRRTVQPRHLWLVVPFLALALTSVRAIPPAWFGLLPVIAIALSGVEIGSTGRLRPKLAGIFVAVVVVLPFLLIEGSRLSTERFPVSASDHLGEAPTFHDDVTGGYLIYAQGPERQVYLDDRAELYGKRLGEFVEVRTGALDWRPIFERDRIEQALLRKSEKLVGNLINAGWAVIHEDESFVVLRTE